MDRNKYQHHFEVCLRYLIIWPYSEPKTIILAIVAAPTAAPKRDCRSFRREGGAGRSRAAGAKAQKLQ